jgi:hypothetical protein
MKKLVAALFVAGTLVFTACGVDHGAVVEDPKVVPAGANPDLLKIDAAFRSLPLAQQQAFCLLIATKGEYSTANFAYYDENANVRNPNVTFTETLALINSLAYYHCAVRNQDIDVATDLKGLV